MKIQQKVFLQQLAVCMFSLTLYTRCCLGPGFVFSAGYKYSRAQERVPFFPRYATAICFAQRHRKMCIFPRLALVAAGRKKGHISALVAGFSRAVP